MVPLHAQIAGEPAPAFLKRSRLPGLLDEARAAVLKARIRTDALAAMDLAIGAGSAAGVYKARDALIERYVDLAQDPELIKRMTQANDLVRRAVKVESTRRVAQREPRPGPLGPATSLVLRSTTETPPPPTETGSMAFALADGLAYGLDAATGAPSGRSSWASRLPSFPRPFRETLPCWSSMLATTSSCGSTAAPERSVWRLELGEAGGKTPPGAGRPALPGLAQRQAGGDRPRVG